MEWGDHKLRNANSHQAESFQRKCSPANTLISDLWPPELWENKFVVSGPLDFGHLLQQPWANAINNSILVRSPGFKSILLFSSYLFFSKSISFSELPMPYSLNWDNQTYATIPLSSNKNQMRSCMWKHSKYYKILYKYELIFLYFNCIFKLGLAMSLYPNLLDATLYTNQYLPNFSNANIISTLNIKFYLQN